MGMVDRGDCTPWNRILVDRCDPYRPWCSAEAITVDIQSHPLSAITLSSAPLSSGMRAPCHESILTTSMRRIRGTGAAGLTGQGHHTSAGPKATIGGVYTYAKRPRRRRTSAGSPIAFPIREAAQSLGGRDWAAGVHRTLLP